MLGQESRLLLRGMLLHEQLEVYYQPQVDLKTHHVRGLEALVRCNNGSDILTPNQFLPWFEEFGMMKDLDRFVMDRVIRDMSVTPFEELGIEEVSVNCSYALLADPGFLPFLLDRTSHYRMPRNKLTVELTESSRVVEMERVIDRAKQLRMAGIALVLDDFCTGFQG